MYTGPAYGSTVRFEDGSSYTFEHRERPHLVWNGSTPIALTNGVRYNSTTLGDYSVTLLQPLAQQ